LTFTNWPACPPRCTNPWLESWSAVMSDD
jgi:hypothetical protein